MSAACTPLILGARGSRLAQAQVREVMRRLQHAWPRLHITQRVVQTTGDRVRHVPLPQIGQKGLFTVELEQALRRGHIDAAVHSYKDLALAQDDDLPVVAVLPRTHWADVLVTRPITSREGSSLPELLETKGLCPPRSGGGVGTSSVRRKALLLHARPDLRVIDVRGNVDTRLARLQDPEGPYDGLVLAQAGLHRLNALQDFAFLQGMTCHILQPFKTCESTETSGGKATPWLPAPAQGALAIQCRAEKKWLELFAPLDHITTRLETAAERALLGGLGGGCSLPIGAHALWRDGCLTLEAVVLAVDGTKRIDVHGQCVCQADSFKRGEAAAQALGQKLAAQALALGAGELLRGL